MLRLNPLFTVILFSLCKKRAISRSITHSHKHRKGYPWSHTCHSL